MRRGEQRGRDAGFPVHERAVDVEGEEAEVC